MTYGAIAGKANPAQQRGALSVAVNNGKTRSPQTNKARWVQPHCNATGFIRLGDKV